MQRPTRQCRSDLERFGFTQCAHCGDLLHQDEAIHTVYYTGGEQETEDFCGENCKHQWYIHRLNTLGM